ncbi:A24 family peptidase [Thalassotalea mangrovi]|uniref:A24 family peptidase n=1 Tax=Thalassotalea mangrovi TaxID=2572245 RepID=UPI00145F89B7|nr:prepilin peptidase [Thalassotalea mangrovi]
MFEHPDIIKILMTLLIFLIALTSDLRTQRIPNVFCLAVFAIGILIQALQSGWNGLGSALLGSLVACTLLLPAFMIRALGAGDVKLMIAVGTFTGPWLILWSILYAVIAGVITCIVLAAWKTGLSGLKKTASRYYQIIILRHYLKPEPSEAASLRVPYAPALAIGWLWACSHNSDIQWAISSFRYSIGI